MGQAGLVHVTDRGGLGTATVKAEYYALVAEGGLAGKVSSVLHQVGASDSHCLLTGTGRWSSEMWARVPHRVTCDIDSLEWATTGGRHV